MWNADGWDAETRLGVLTPHADVGPESELQAMAPEGVGIHAARVPFGAMRAGGEMDATIPLAPVRAFAAPPNIDDAAEMLAAAPLAAVGIAFTSSGYVLGGVEEKATAARLEERTGGLPVVPTCASAVQALGSLEIERMMLVNPPWFDSELDALGVAFFRDQGFAVVSSGPAVLPSAQTRIDPAALHAYIRERIPDEAQAVFMGGNGFRAVGVIEALERELGRPVLTANQVLLWGMLGRSRARRRVAGYGRLFSQRAG